MTWPAIAVHHDYIVAQLKAGVRMSTIHQRLRDEHGLGAGRPALHAPETGSTRYPRLFQAGEMTGSLGRFAARSPVSVSEKTLYES